MPTLETKLNNRCKKYAKIYTADNRRVKKVAPVVKKKLNLTRKLQGVPKQKHVPDHLFEVGAPLHGEKKVRFGPTVIPFAKHPILKNVKGTGHASLTDLIKEVLKNYPESFSGREIQELAALIYQLEA